MIGPKEIGGQSHSEIGFLNQLDDPRRFITNYQIKLVQALLFQQKNLVSYAERAKVNF